MVRDRMRVLHFTRFINRNDFIDTVIRFADPRRFSMAACTLTGESNIEVPGYERIGIPHIVLECERRPRYALAIARLARVLRRNRIDILHTHHYEETLLGVLAARLARTPAVVIGRHYHDELYLVAAGVKLRALLAVEGFCNRLAQAIVVPSTQIQELLVERQLIPIRKVRVIPYGFDFEAERYRPAGAAVVDGVRRELDLDGHVIIGNFARHYALKGQEYLLAAFEKLVRDYPEARLLMVGDGPCHEKLRAMAGDLGLESRVIFTGWRQDVSRLIEAVDVVAHPTLQEAFPQLMVETLAKAKPLIITRISGASDHIEHGRTGLLIPTRDTDAICAALRWTLEHPGEARLMGERGREYALHHLDIRRVIRRFEECYEALLDRRSETG